MSLRTFNIALFGICISVFISLQVAAQTRPAEIPKQLTLVKEYKHYLFDLSDDGQLLLLSTQTKGYDPITKIESSGYTRVIEFESGREIDRFSWVNVGGGRFLPGSHQILFRSYILKTKGIDKNDVTIRDTLKKESRKCLVTSIANGGGGNMYPLDSQQAIVEFDESASMSPDKLYLLTLADCSLKEIGQIKPEGAPDTVRSMSAFSSRNKRFFAIAVATRNGDAYTGTKIAIWDIDTHKVIKWISPKFSSEQEGYTPDGKFFIVNYSENRKTYVQLYETEKYELVVQKELSSESGDVAFSPDGKYLAFTYSKVVDRFLFSYVEPTVELYDLQTWNKVAVGKYPRYAYIWDKTFPLTGGFMKFTPDSKYLISDTDFTRIWRIPL